MGNIEVISTQWELTFEHSHWVDIYQKRRAFSPRVLAVSISHWTREKENVHSLNQVQCQNGYDRVEMGSNFGMRAHYMLANSCGELLSHERCFIFVRELPVYVRVDLALECRLPVYLNLRDFGLLMNSLQHWLFFP